MNLTCDDTIYSLCAGPLCCRFERRRQSIGFGIISQKSVCFVRSTNKYNTRVCVDNTRILGKSKCILTVECCGISFQIFFIICLNSTCFSGRESCITISVQGNNLRCIRGNDNRICFSSCTRNEEIFILVRIIIRSGTRNKSRNCDSFYRCTIHLCYSFKFATYYLNITCTFSCSIYDDCASITTGNSTTLDGDALYFCAFNSIGNGLLDCITFCTSNCAITRNGYGDLSRISSIGLNDDSATASCNTRCFSCASSLSSVGSRFDISITRNIYRTTFSIQTGITLAVTLNAPTSKAGSIYGNGTGIIH